MLFANDYNDNRIHISETHSNQTYYCPFCGVPLITKKGNIRQHHFAHSASHHCKDSWEREGNYDMSPWHNEWQSLFPKENQEIKLSLGDTSHRADILIDRSVIEFQHSVMPVKAFDDRNNFYFNLGYKVIWLFDLSDEFENGKLTFHQEDDALKFNWKNPKRAFNSYDVKSGCIDLFFQLSENPNDERIIRVIDVSDEGFESFDSTAFIQKKDFLEYVGLHNGKCAPPYRDDLEANSQYATFCQEYSISLNKQQERAVHAIEGANLLLAVPGSGKTTVLIARLGNMVLNKGINPSDILAITFNKKAAEEMKTRFSNQFGEGIGDKITFSTINALCYSIYRQNCRTKQIAKKSIIDDKDRKRLLVKVLRKFIDDYPTENDILELEQAIGFIKNMMLSDNDIAELDQTYKHLSKMFIDYQKELNDANQMDFDDQMVFALDILYNDTSVLLNLKNRFRYISVDEAQDTSRIQHEIIKLISSGNNLFMVGDEDQSIYGFRAAYPKALLNFRYDYTNPYIMRMERNYRSTEQIVDKAQLFISKNKGRYEKHMTAERGPGDEVKLIPVNDRESQYSYLLDVAKNNTSETAFLFRDNESSVVLVDLFLRNDIPFKLRTPDMNFFGTKVVLDIISYLKLTLDDHDYSSLEVICNKGILYLKNQQLKCAVNDCKYGKSNIFDALEKQMKYVQYKYRDRAEDFKAFVTTLSSLSPTKALDLILENGYESYLEKSNYDYGKIEILKMLAKEEDSIQSYLSRLQYLESQIKSGFDSKAPNPIVLSTIHSSKGLEYDTVYLVDVYDGRFPSSKPNIFNRSKDNLDGEQEERRLFYVGLTRAKNHLNLFSIKGKNSSFVDELFPESKAEKERIKQRENEEMLRKIHDQLLKQQRIQEEKRKHQKEKEEARRKEYEELRQKEIEKEKKQLVEQEKKCFENILSIIDQQDYQARDYLGRRWVRCKKCGKVDLASEFSSYGGLDHINLGICSECMRKI